MSFSFGNDSCLLEKSRLNVFRINTVIIINPTALYAGRRISLYFLFTGSVCLRSSRWSLNNQLLA